MFKTIDTMRMEPTPERVIAVCRMVAHESLTKDELLASLTLGKGIDKAQELINPSIAVACEELGMIKLTNNYYELAVPKDVFYSTAEFRRFVSKKVFSNQESTFYKFTKWIIEKNDTIFSLEKWEVMAKTCASELPELSHLDENSALGWRFWATFLGIGYLNRTMFLPNMKLRLQDILASDFNTKLEYGKTIRAIDFMEWLSPRIPEVDTGNKLPLALSAGLRTLHELGLIKLETWPDSERIVLFQIDGDPINDFSHITVREEVAK